MKNKFILRLSFLYFFIQAVPLDPKYYQGLFTGEWWRFSYGTIFNLAHYIPRFSSGPPAWSDWAIIFVIALAGAAAWTAIDRRRDQQRGSIASGAGNDDALFYWIRTIVRYRLAIGILAYGFIKLFPLQAPFPSLSNLNTNYGDFTRWKLFSLSLGIVPSYEFFLGLVEIVAGLLLFNRRSASIGAFILAIFLGNVFMSNLAYGGGDAVYSLYLLSLALFILSWDLQRLANLLFFQKPALPNPFQLILPAGWQRGTRIALKTFLFFFFVVLYGFETRSGYHSDPYQYPVTKGLEGLSGIYNVTTFKKGKDTLAYSKTDPVRWQDVVFEKWATISIRSNRPVVLDSTNVERPQLSDSLRDYELQGAAGRHYYSYEADTANQLLILHNKNPHYTSERLVLYYDRGSASHITFSGLDQDRDSVYVVLDKLDKKYLLEEAGKAGRQKGLKL
jgi:hypothetical protein